MKKCIRCELKTMLTDEAVNAAVDKIRSMSGIQTASEEVYKSRLYICSQCEKLEYGATCMVCGCIVNVRAIIARERCPYPKNNKWQ